MLDSRPSLVLAGCAIAPWRKLDEPSALQRTREGRVRGISAEFPPPPAGARLGLDAGPSPFAGFAVKEAHLHGGPGIILIDSNSLKVRE